MPAWYQDRQHVPHEELNAMGIRVPLFHDAVKLRLPDRSGGLRRLHTVLSDDWDFRHHPYVGARVLIVGYPYGYSIAGQDQPTATVLTRFIAGWSPLSPRQTFLVDGIGAPGMSGGPVLIDGDAGWTVIGLYEGAIYPDAERHGRRTLATGLGRCCPVQLMSQEPLAPHG